ncbi:MAG: hypothetical protein ACI915_003886 [Gammaproteobacteria bacterium]
MFVSKNRPDRRAGPTVLRNGLQAARRQLESYQLTSLSWSCVNANSETHDRPITIGHYDRRYLNRRSTIGRASGAIRSSHRSRIDGNQDRLISRAEHHSYLRGTFFLSDLDKSGSICASELDRVANMSFKQGILEIFDVGLDGGLDLHESQRALALDFEAADLNQDGALDFSEFANYFE